MTPSIRRTDPNYRRGSRIAPDIRGPSPAAHGTQVLLSTSHSARYGQHPETIAIAATIGKDDKRQVRAEANEGNPRTCPSRLLTRGQVLPGPSAPGACQPPEYKNTPSSPSSLSPGSPRPRLLPALSCSSLVRAGSTTTTIAYRPSVNHPRHSLRVANTPNSGFAARSPPPHHYSPRACRLRHG